MGIPPHDMIHRRLGLLTVVKPIPKAVESVFDQVFGRSKVEPRIDCIRY